MNSSPPPFPVNLYVDPLKITGYLLTHPSKCGPFIAAGFSAKLPTALDGALKAHATPANLTKTVPAKFGGGWTFVFEGAMPGVSGSGIKRVRTVWQVNPGSIEATLVTAYKMS